MIKAVIIVAFSFALVLVYMQVPIVAQFGSGFQMSLAKGSGTKRFYPLTTDKKYILYNCADWGEYMEDKETNRFTIKLKKSGSSYIIKSIKSTK